MNHSPESLAHSAVLSALVKMINNIDPEVLRREVENSPLLGDPNSPVRKETIDYAMKIIGRK